MPSTRNGTTCSTSSAAWPSSGFSSGQVSASVFLTTTPGYLRVSCVTWRARQKFNNTGLHWMKTMRRSAPVALHSARYFPTLHSGACWWLILVTGMPNDPISLFLRFFNRTEKIRLTCFSSAPWFNEGGYNSMSFFISTYKMKTE